MADFKNCDFTHLHVHTCNSLLDGANKNKELVMRAREMGFKGLAITDHGVISGWIKFIKECAATKDKDGRDIPYPTIKPLLGAEFYLCRKMEWKNKELQPEGRKGNRHLILGARNYEGYKNLCRLSEKSWTDGFYSSPRIDLELLAQHSEGLYCQSACLSSVVNANLLYDRYDKAKRICTYFKDIFKEHFYLEVMYHGIDAEKLIIPDIFKLSKELDIPVVVDNDVHYLKKEQAKSHEILLCLNSSRCIKDPKHLSFNYDEFYLKSASEMGDIFGHTPEVLYNTNLVVDSVDMDDITKNLFGGGTHLPVFDIPQEFKTNKPFEGEFAYLRKLGVEGMKRLGWHKSQRHIEKFNKELNDIRVAWESNSADFATYFLIEHEIFDFAEKKGILSGPGRGSGFASVLLHCLGICYGVDPTDEKYNLMWERFLGFDEIKFITAKDFGFEEKKDLSEILSKDAEIEEIADEEEEIEEHFA